MKKVKGMYTIEAALIMPMVLFMILAGIKLGIGLHQEVKEKSTTYEEVKKIDEIELVHKMQTIGELGGITGAD